MNSINLNDEKIKLNSPEISSAFLLLFSLLFKMQTGRTNCVAEIRPSLWERFVKQGLETNVDGGVMEDRTGPE